jgi:hypothetical protein
MAYDFASLFARSYSKFPAGWFPVDPTQAPNVSAIVGGLATGLAQNFTTAQFVAAQAFIQTATGEFLDLCAVDYFGFGHLPRRKSELDASYRARILAELLRPRGTRAALISVLEEVTGKTPRVFEPIRDGSKFNVSSFGGARLGSYATPNQCWVDVWRPSGPGSSVKKGFNTGFFNFKTPFADAADLWSNVEDQEIYRAISSTIPAGTICWTRLLNGSPA